VIYGNGSLTFFIHNYCSVLYTGKRVPGEKLVPSGNKIYIVGSTGLLLQ